MTTIHFMRNPCLVCRCPCKKFEMFTQEHYEDQKDQDKIDEDEKFYTDVIKQKVCLGCFHKQADHRK